MSMKAQLAQAARPSQAFCFIISHSTASARGRLALIEKVGVGEEKGTGQAGEELQDRHVTAQESAARGTIQWA